MTVVRQNYMPFSICNQIQFLSSSRRTNCFTDETISVKKGRIYTKERHQCVFWSSFTLRCKFCSSEQVDNAVQIVRRTVARASRDSTSKQPSRGRRRKRRVLSLGTPAKHYSVVSHHATASGERQPTMDALSVEVFDAKKSSRSIATLNDVSPGCTVLDIKKLVAQKKAKLGVERQSLRLEAKGKSLKDEQTLASLGLDKAKNVTFYVKDLGPQIAWKTVFLLEYAGPFFIYPLFYLRPSFIYGQAASRPVYDVVTLALLCNSFHYAKRLFETQFIHRFSNGTMPLSNLFKNCTYYWGFCAFISYFINHPYYKLPALGLTQIYFGFAGFALSEMGNFSIHVLLRNLRPAGTKERRIPFPTSNIFTQMYNYVSCPNYTYEVYSWVFFTIMTQSLPALLFTVAGFIQMTIWAKNKQRAYKKEFPNYPKNRTAIIPFLL
ncbi:hypothetical protein L596_002311 [Steinernema carpocapsae]|uniref:very-long-chain enoyl-CoA reductase n=2 Tax=Steinernema carpocapsae TaxID=34508 RepID=A0A4U8UP55_STECR|nr:hypothetical protein L596_002311 [Steinernema carpocapsae]